MSRLFQEKNYKKLSLLFFAIMAVLPIILGIIHVYRFGVNVLFWDEWDTVSLIQNYYKGTINYHHLFAQHNEHRIFFPKIIILIISLITKGNTLAQMYFIDLLLLLLLITYLKAFDKSFKFKENYLWFIPIPFLVFNYHQTENMLWGFQIGFVMTCLFVILAAYYSYRFQVENLFLKKNMYFILSLICGTVGTFSSSMGLLIWAVVFIPMVILVIRENKNKIYALTWIVVGIIEWLIYFHNYVKPQAHPTLTLMLEKPLNFLIYFLAAIGGSLFQYLDLALVTGVIIFIMAIFCIYLLFKYDRIRKNYFWIAVAIFGFLTVAAIAVGRLGFGVEQGLSSRYTTFSLVIPIAIYAILLDLSKNTNSKISKYIINSLLTIIIVSLPISYEDGIRQGREMKVSREKAKFALLNYDTVPDEDLLALFPATDLIREKAPLLKEKGFNVFKENLEGNSISNDLKAEALRLKFEKGEAAIVKQGEEGAYISFNGGWAVDTQLNNTVKDVYLEIDKKIYSTNYGLYRADIANTLGNSKYVHSGFERNILVSSVGIGKHELIFKVLTRDNKIIQVDMNKIIIDVKKEGVSIYGF